MGFWGDLGAGAAESTINGIIGQAFADINARRANKYWNMQADKLWEQSEQSAENAMQRQIEIYNTLQSPQALVQQYKDAGLNPYLLNGQSGKGGNVASAPQGQAGNGANFTNMQGAQNPMDMQAELRKAQVQNIQADTNLKKEQTGKTQWEKEYAKWNADIQELEAKFKEQNFNTNTYLLLASLYKLKNEADSAGVRAEIDEATKETVIREATARVAMIEWQTELHKLNANLTQTQILETAQKIENLIIEGELTEAKIFEIYQEYNWTFNKKDLKYIGDKLFNLVEAFIPSIKINAGKPKQETQNVNGYEYNYNG